MARERPEVRCPVCRNKVLTRPNQTSATCRCGTRFNTSTGGVFSPATSTGSPSGADSRKPKTVERPEVREPTKDEVAEFNVAPEQAGDELFRLMRLLPLGGHWGTEIRPYREAGGDYLIWHVDDPVRRAAAGEALWPGDASMLKFLRSIAQNREGSLPLVEVVLTTLKVDKEKQPIPVLELRYLHDQPNRSPVIGRTPLVANGRNYVPGYLQTVNGFAGAAGMIEASGYVLLNCDNVEDLDSKWRKLAMRLLTSARIEL